MPDFALIVPSFHAELFIGAFAEALRSQTHAPRFVAFIDSTPSDASAEAVAAAGLPVHRIASSDFDHGSTRNLGVSLAYAAGVDLVVMMTQDAVLASPDSLGELLTPFSDAGVGAVFGRQLPRAGASGYEHANRVLRYPPSSYVANEKSGNRRYFMSNAFAAYRISALTAVGGFPAPTLFGEDAIASFRLQSAGHRVMYRASATVRHSHPARFLTEVRRFFDVGVAGRQRTMPREWAAKGEGVKSAMSETRLAWQLGGVSATLTAVAMFLARAIGMAVGGITWLPNSIGGRFAYSRAAYHRVVGRPSRAR